MNMGSYHYDNLDQSSNEIRLATLVSVHDQQMRVRLETFPIATAPDFVALSYVWGSVKRTKEIIVNSTPFHIRQNLWQGLQALWNGRDKIRRQIRQIHCPNQRSLPALHITFWADALCIDQNNVSERTQQVNMMSDIYTAADLVVVWLGLAADDSNTAVDFIANPKANWNREGWDLISPIGQAIRMNNTIEKAVVALLERRYWRRMWIVQELCLAREILVLCGTRALAWHHLSSFVELLSRASNSRYTTAEARDTRQAHGCDVIAAKDLDDSSKLSLELVILRFGRQECSDVRDKIFGCLGLVDFQGKKPFAADYSLSASDLALLVSEHLYMVMAPGLLESVNRIAWRNLGLRSEDQLAVDSCGRKAPGGLRQVGGLTSHKRVFRFAESATDEDSKA